MSDKRFQKTRIVDKWGGIYDSETDRVLNVNDVEHKLNEQQATIQSLKEENEQLKAILKQLYFKTDDKFIDNNDVLYLERLCNDE